MKQEMSNSKSTSSSAGSQQKMQANDRYAVLLASCYIALKNITLYPPGHQQLSRCLEQAHKAISTELNTESPLTFGIAKDIVLVDGLPVASNLQTITDFARLLNAHGIASITFHRGLDKKTLSYFFQLLSYSPEKAAGENGIQQELIAHGCNGINLLLVDYNLFQLSEKNGQNVEQVPKKKGPLDTVWVTFTRRLLQDYFSGSKESGSDNKDDNQEEIARDPVQLAKFINENKLDAKTSLHNFGVMLDRILSSSMKKRAESSAITVGDQELADEKSMSTEGSSMVGLMLDELNPVLRKQFLATTLDKCQENVGISNPQQLLSHLSSTVVTDMLDMVNEEGREISPALLSLIQGMSTSQSGNILEETDALSLYEVETLMAREKYDKYVEPEYGKLLQIIGQNQNRVVPPHGFHLEEQVQTFETAYLVDHTVHLVLALMERIDNEEEYALYGQKLLEITLDLPALGLFSLVDVIADLFSRHTESHSSPAIRHLAEDCLERIRGREYVESIAALLSDDSAANKITAIQALIGRGKQAVSELLEFYCEEEESRSMEDIKAFFHKYRTETLAEIIRLIPRAKSSKILFLLALVRKLGVGSAAPLLHPLLNHHEESIRLEVFALLLPLQDSVAVQYVRDMLHSPNESVLASATTFIWRYKVTALLPDLLSLLNYRCLKKKTIQRNSRIILALSGIADPAALPSLEKLADSKCFFHSKEVAEMKTALFRSLSAYPLDSVKLLCEKGLKNKGLDIRKTCKSILSRRGVERQ
jgi:HEAT repeat protein